MSRALPTPVAMVGAAFAVVAILLASYFVARTPRDVLGGDFPQAAPVSQDRTQVPYTLEEGRSAGDIGKDLEELGVIRSGRQFELLASLIGVHRQLSAGDFLLHVHGLGGPSGANLLAPYLTKVAIDDNIASGDVRGLMTTALLLMGAGVWTLFITYMHGDHLAPGDPSQVHEHRHH